jgi:hypothetical protein
VERLLEKLGRGAALGEWNGVVPEFDWGIEKDGFVD